MGESFRALVLYQEDGKTISRIEQLNDDQLPAGEVLVDVLFSTLNYKDALAITGAGKIVRSFPSFPGSTSSGGCANRTIQPGNRATSRSLPVGDWESGIGAASLNGRDCRRAGSSACRRGSHPSVRWRSAPLALPPCSV